MASRIVSWLVFSLCLLGLGFAAPTTQEPSLALGSLLAERSTASSSSASSSLASSSSSSSSTTTTTTTTTTTSSSSSSSSVRHSAWSRFSGRPRSKWALFRIQDKTLSPSPSRNRDHQRASASSSSFLEYTLGLAKPSVNVAIVSVPSGPKSKSQSSKAAAAAAHTNGELLTVTYGGHKAFPVWARLWTSQGFRDALRLTQGVAIFILASSLGMAIVCSYLRSQCSTRQQIDWLDLEHADPRLVAKDDQAHHVQDGSYMLELQQKGATEEQDEEEGEESRT